MPHTLPPPVTALERALRIEEGDLEGVDLAAAEDALRDATDLALDEVSSRVAEHWREDCPGSVRAVVVQAAYRGYTNPRRLSQEGQGDHNATAAVTSGVYLTEREAARLRRKAQGTGRYTGSVRTPSAYSGEDNEPLTMSVGALDNPPTVHGRIFL